MKNDDDMARLSRLTQQAYVRMHTGPASLKSEFPPQSVAFVRRILIAKFPSRSDITKIGRHSKRLFDVLAAALIIVFVSPIFAFIALAVKLTDSGSVFYSHKRVGRDGQEFGCLKFRTMVSNGDQVLDQYLANDPEAQSEWILNRKLKHDPRVTAIGRILRKSSLDEIPQLFNVLRGEMSLVGPRPVMADELIHYGSNKQLYFCVRPGLTGLWQVSGRSDLSYEKRVELDCEYVKNWSFSRDIALILCTIPVVLSARGSC